jgi:hypothetical protein
MTESFGERAHGGDATGEPVASETLHGTDQAVDVVG